MPELKDESDGSDQVPADANDSVEPESSAERACSACQKMYVPDEDQRDVCPDCHDRRTAVWVVGLFLLFFCFVLLPLLIQLLGTPRPPR
jgi:hypothetical protein